MRFDDDMTGVCEGMWNGNHPKNGNSLRHSNDSIVVIFLSLFHRI